jgi:tRNA modification GTPase
MPTSPATELIAAIATPAGRGGIGIVRLSGPDLQRVIDGVVGRALEPRVATSANFVGAHGETLDQGLALYFPAPASYTGETVLELHGHGGPAVLAQILRRCLDLGARLAEPGEFTKRAFLNGKIDLAQAEGVADLIDAATATAARAAARSLSGAFSAEVRALVDRLTELRMFTEATLDFPDEDIEFMQRADAVGKLASLRERLDSIAARSRQGSLLREGLDVVLIGQPNVGKSSLMNQLACDDVAIVTPHAGTTRDAIRSSVEIRGIPLHIIDTAGLRESADPIERIGIERTWATIARADLALIVTDARESDQDADVAIVGRLPGSKQKARHLPAQQRYGFRPRPAPASSSFARPCLRQPARTRTWRARFSHASGICRRCARPERTSMRRGSTCVPRRRRSNSSPRSSAARSSRFRRSPAKSAPTTCSV